MYIFIYIPSLATVERQWVLLQLLIKLYIVIIILFIFPNVENSKTKYP